jgi:hypothetical protein
MKFLHYLPVLGFCGSLLSATAAYDLPSIDTKPPTDLNALPIAQTIQLCKDACWTSYVVCLVDTELTPAKKRNYMCRLAFQDCVIEEMSLFHTMLSAKNSDQAKNIELKK